MDRSQPGDEARELYSLEGETEPAFAILTAIRERVDHYFVQCQAVVFDPRLAEQLPPHQADLASSDLKDSKAIEQLMAQAPLATSDSGSVPHFSQTINTLDRANWDRLVESVVHPILGEQVDRLTRHDWQQPNERFAVYKGWIEAKPRDAVAALGQEKMKASVDGGYTHAVRELIDQSRQTARQLDNVRLTEKITLYQAYLLDIANNFVSLPNLYDPKRRAMFETGALVMDGRRFDFAVKVENRAEHTKVAGTSSMFVLYLPIQRHDVPTPLEMVVPVTSGGQGNLVDGKRGVLEDINGKQWDARILKNIDNPISIGEAVLDPFKRIGKLVGGKIEQITGAVEKELDTASRQSSTRVASESVPPPKAAPAMQQRLLAGGMLAGAGVAVAAFGSAAAFIVKKFSKWIGSISRWGSVAPCWPCWSPTWYWPTSNCGGVSRVRFWKVRAGPLTPACA